MAQLHQKVTRSELTKLLFLKICENEAKFCIPYLTTANKVGISGQDIDQLSLAFVSPLRP